MIVDLKNKVAIVTGGSRGIGREIACSLLKKGAKVCITARTESELYKTQRELREEGEVFAKPINVAEADSVKLLVAEILGRYGRLDILVNCAGVQGAIGPFWECSLDDWKDAFSINLFGTIYTCRAVLPHMVERKQGKIINFSGGGATGPRPNFSAYAASKAAIVRLTETLAEELGPFNIQVNAIAPGGVNTRMLDEVLDAGGEKVGKEYQDAIRRKKEGGAQAELAAELVCYLASEASNGLTGKLIAAPWDPWKEWMKGNLPKLTKNMYTLRRVDGRNIIEG